jgi:hypothetical protein
MTCPIEEGDSLACIGNAVFTSPPDAPYEAANYSIPFPKLSRPAKSQLPLSDASTTSSVKAYYGQWTTTVISAAFLTTTS